SCISISVACMARTTHRPHRERVKKHAHPFMCGLGAVRHSLGVTSRRTGGPRRVGRRSTEAGPPQRDRCMDAKQQTVESPPELVAPACKAPPVAGGTVSLWRRFRLFGVILLLLVGAAAAYFQTLTGQLGAAVSDMQ